MKKTTQQRLRNCKRRILSRRDKASSEDSGVPVLTASNIKYEMARRTRGITAGGIGAMHLLAKKVGLQKHIDDQVHVLKVHKPYHESDHVLNLAYSVLAGGTCIQDIELLRNNESYLDSLGAKRTPGASTAGDFLRRFSEMDIELLQDAINDARLNVWRRQPDSFREEAIIDADGTLVRTLGETKEGMDINYKGQWGYGTLLVSLSNTNEPLFLKNRAGNRPSHEGAAEYLEAAIDLVDRAGFKKVTLRGDTDFSQTEHLDRWNEAGVRFTFGYDSTENLRQTADCLDESAWSRLCRPKKVNETEVRQRPRNVKEAIVRSREFVNLRLLGEDYAEFDYKPTACKEPYRMVVLRKNISKEKGEAVLFEEIRYFFYITNDRKISAEDIIFLANGRCGQEGLIGELKSGVYALRAPVDNLLSNWAFMVTASLAWSMKAWFALTLPETGRWKAKYAEEKAEVLGMGFKRFLNAFIRMPAQIIRTGRRIVFRLLDWNPFRPIFFRALDALETKMNC